MLRSVRRISPILRALLLGAVTVTATGAATTVLVGCTDENAVETHISRLEDPIKQTASIKRIVEMFGDAMTRDDGDRDGKNVKPLLDKVVEPMTKVAQTDLDESTKGTVLAFLADTRDPRALPALVKALTDYRMDDKRPEKFDSQISEVVRNIGEMVRSGKVKDNKEVNSALFGLFVKTNYAYPKAQNQGMAKMLAKVLRGIADPSWESQLLGMVKKPIKSTKKKYAKAAMNQAYWQITAASILGALKSKKAAEPLLKVTLTPFKAPVHNDAMIALIRIGKPAADASLGLLTSGEDNALRKYASEEFLRNLTDQGKKETKAAKTKAASTYLNQAVKVAANIGNDDVVGPLLAAMESGDKGVKGTVGSQLHLLPKDAKVMEAFKGVYTTAGVAEKLPDGSYAKESLITAGTSFFERDMLTFMLEDAQGLKGEKADVDGVKVAVLTTAMKSADNEQWPHIEKLMGVFPANKGKNVKFVVKDAKTNKELKLTDNELIAKIENLEIKKGMAKPDTKDGVMTPLHEIPALTGALQKAGYVNAVRNAKKVLDACKKDVGCYLKKITDPEANKEENSMQAIKAAYMAGMLGGDDVKMKLVELIPKIKNGEVLSAIQLILLNKSPKGDDAVADKLMAMYLDAEQKRNKLDIAKLTGFKLVSYRLKARK